jgi:glutaredoxin 3
MATAQVSQRPRIAYARAMADVTVYTTEACPFCMRAKAFLDQRGVPYEEVFISRSDHHARERLVEETGGYTFPQVIINGNNIGGWDQLAALDQAGELDGLLA